MVTNGSIDGQLIDLNVIGENNIDEFPFGIEIFSMQSMLGLDLITLNIPSSRERASAAAHSSQLAGQGIPYYLPYVMCVG